MATENAKIAGILETLKGLTVLELSELVHAVEDEFGVSAAAAVAVAAGPVAAAAEEEKTEFDVILTDAGASKAKLIIALKGALGVGLADAKALVEAVPKAVKEAISKEAAEELKAKLEEVGAKVEIK
ncbi:MAG: 50S ribosomal protein L7/L12 [Oscillospiraceae bacterium]|jgi:large subunit ribosomal protein L7/L12|nr:50S ribosomal protein L7/L12 [Oscillospiraceae bacterium]